MSADERVANAADGVGQRPRGSGREQSYPSQAGRACVRHSASPVRGHATDCHDRNRHRGADSFERVEAGNRVSNRLTSRREDGAKQQVVAGTALGRCPGFLDAVDASPDDKRLRNDVPCPCTRQCIRRQMSTPGSGHHRNIESIVDENARRGLARASG